MVKAKNRLTTGSIFDTKLADREFGKYRAEKLLSRHEFRQTITLLATNKETNERVVLKAFGSFSVKSRKEFEKEIAVFKKLENKHGVLLPLEIFEFEGDYFIVTEYKYGGDLRGWFKTNPKVAEILDVFSQIAKSIDYIHENKIIHRDIKPENVVYEVLDGKITSYLMDFGISVILSDKTSSFKTEHAFGTINYIAPEFFSNEDGKKTKAVDIYAFGLMLYEALEGRHPFIGSTQNETIDRIISGFVPIPENTTKRLGESAGFILTRALSKNPDDRPKTASEIIVQVGSRYVKYVGKTYGKYFIEDYLGQGSYGDTYKAYELNRKSKKVALKLLAVSQVKKTEIGGLKELERGKGILPIIDSGYENGVQYLVTEYLNGYNLRRIFSPLGRDIKDLLEILKPLSKTLDYLHEKTIVHQDLKPENILLQKNKTNGDLQPFINDYGVSKITDITDVLYTNSKVLLGSLNYLAPEILQNKQPSPAADVYSLGVIIYEAIEGETPFDARSFSALIKQKFDDYVPIPRNLLEKRGIRAVRVLLKSLNVNPGKRQGSASDLVSQLEDAINTRTFLDTEVFIEPWIKSRKFFSDFLNFKSKMRTRSFEAERFSINSNSSLPKTKNGLGKKLRVFLCHSSNDKSKVRHIYEQLNREKGIDPWLDEKKLLPGAEWDLTIRLAVKSSDVVVVCLSNGSINKEGYVQKEISQALDVAEEKPEGTLFIIPLRLEECDVPNRLQRWQWLNYYEENSYARLLDSLKIRAKGLEIDLE